MNASRPAPENAYRANDLLWAGEPIKAYPPAAYRPVQGGGYVLCACAVETCIRKCCPQNWAYVEGKCSALDSSLDDEFEVPEYVNENGTVSTYATGQFHLVYGKLTCVYKYRIIPSLHKNDSFRITKTGWLLNESGATIAPPDKFCLESFSTEHFQTLPVVCSPELMEN